MDIVIAVVGASGTGKTTIVNFASRALGIPVICSYTTRPKRDGEVDGEDHYFVDVNEMPPREEMLAYTYYGGHHYWTTKSQLNGTCFYVIDEEGLRMLRERVKVLSIYMMRKQISVGKERMERDTRRKTIPKSEYHIVFHNDKTLEWAENKFTTVVEAWLAQMQNGYFIENGVEVL